MDALPSPRFLARAPHRLLFAVGAGNVLLAMAWWTLWLVDMRWHAFGLRQPAVYGGWIRDSSTRATGFDLPDCAQMTGNAYVGM